MAGNFKVWVTRQIPQQGIDMLREVADVEVWEDELPPPRDLILDKIGELDGILALLTDKMDAEVMDRGKKLKVIANYAVGFDNVDVAAATERGILVTNTPGVLTETTADLAFTLLMATARNIVVADKFTRDGKWKTWGPTLLLGQDIHHAKLGLIGLGRIGREMAKRARGFDMDVTYYDVVRNEQAERELGLKYADIDTILKESDFVSLHTPLTPQTRHLIGARELSLMKPTAILINTSRGPVVDQKALYEALRDKVIYAAGLDVFDVEPISKDDPLLTLDNVTVVPHIASASFATRTRMATMAAENLIAGLKGTTPTAPVNPEVLNSPQRRK
ncbi:MAG TPA: D-glycerate dehydrogenase [Armatimonadota bacterium]|jgi:glyoxylate reductase|nr:D-glycerate dehydrogenase [Armatimonadota bacterium]HOM81897.1 D-glycerate dehydrogenase [Armatimonadota bacterium]HOQ27940.1 D-glycerate dehydrogenase [Armatimonadota bacterium]HPO71893.1 D-glycerate dehydrogenase [Armatimonadota bacterium]HPT98885.1 D-glycerate dehydrogenase [Armatimonadota bacterium]